MSTEKELLIDLKRRDELYNRVIKVKQWILYLNNQPAMWSSMSVSAGILFVFNTFLSFCLVNNLSTVTKNDKNARNSNSVLL